MNDFNLDFSSWKASGEIEYLVFGAPVSQDYENSAYGMTLSQSLGKESINKLSISASEDIIKQNNPNFLGLLDLTKTKRDNLELSLIRNKSSKVVRFYNFGLDAEEEDVDYSSYGTTYREKIRTNSIFGSLGLNLYQNPLNLTTNSCKPFPIGFVTILDGFPRCPTPNLIPIYSTFVGSGLFHNVRKGTQNDHPKSSKTAPKTTPKPPKLS